jgi:phosphatidate cytidylyltransferase
MAIDRRALRTRLTIGPILLLTLLGIYLLDSHVTRGRVAAAVVALLGMVGLFEYVRMMRGAGFPIGRKVLLGAGAILHAMPFFFDSWGDLDAELYPPVLITVGLVFVLSVRALARTRMHQGLEEVGSTLLGFVLLSWPLFFTQGLGLRSVPALFFAVLVAKSGDIGGYFAGILLGRKKLIPHVSPGKSVEGALGSLIFAAIVAILLRPLLAQAVSVTLWVTVGLGVLINVTSQLGDLVESLLKRRCGVKDSSQMLPQHGGVLDLVDSLLFSVPAFFFVLVRLT